MGSPRDKNERKRLTCQRGLALKNQILIKQAKFYERVGALGNAMKIYKKASRIPELQEISLSSLERLCQVQGQYKEALKYGLQFLKRHNNRSLQQLIRYFGGRNKALCSCEKLTHDLEQIEYLINQGLLSKQKMEPFSNYKIILKKYKGRKSSFQLTQKDLSILGPSYFKTTYLYAPRAQKKSPLNSKLDYKKIQEEYLQNDLVVIDDFLTTSALQELRRACLESTFWSVVRNNDYIGAHQGFANELIYQIVESISHKFPQIIQNQVLTDLWCFKYASKNSGIPLHADGARVNLNFWITPDSANLDKKSGGMVIYKLIPPASWDTSDYNSIYGMKKVENYLRRKKAKPVRIGYRENRIVIFNSQYFHKTDDIFFKEGYENRRTNITFLYGQPRRNLG